MLPSLGSQLCIASRDHHSRNLNISKSFWNVCQQGIRLRQPALARPGPPGLLYSNYVTRAGRWASSDWSLGLRLGPWLAEPWHCDWPGPAPAHANSVTIHLALAAQPSCVLPGCNWNIPTKEMSFLCLLLFLNGQADLWPLIRPRVAFYFCSWPGKVASGREMWGTWWVTWPEWPGEAARGYKASRGGEICVIESLSGA